MFTLSTYADTMSTGTIKPAPRIAILIDAENVSAEHLAFILRHARALGSSIIRRAFGDFGGCRLDSWAVACAAQGVEPVFQPSAGAGKNSTDIAITIHAMDILHRRVVEGVCLVSSDRDFVPLARRLVQDGISVHVFCTAAASRALQAVCTGIVALPQPAAKTITVDRPTRALSAQKRRLISIIGGAPTYDPREGIALGAAALAIRNAAPDLIATYCGVGKFRRRMEETQLFDILGEGPAMHLRLRSNAVPAGGQG